MNLNGLVLTVAGVWVLTQVFAGDALRRLRIIASPAGTPTATPPPVRGRGRIGGNGGGNGGGGSW